MSRGGRFGTKVIPDRKRNLEAYSLYTQCILEKIGHPYRRTVGSPAVMAFYKVMPLRCGTNIYPSIIYTSYLLRVMEETGANPS